MMDETDLKIIHILMENSRIQWKEIGAMIHMTGQGVAVRIHRLEELGIIEKYTLKLNDEKLGKLLTGFIIVYMKSTKHKEFREFLTENELVAEAHKISGDGCYLIKIKAEGKEDLNLFLDELTMFANYKLLLSVDKIKD